MRMRVATTVPYDHDELRSLIVTGFDRLSHKGVGVSIRMTPQARIMIGSAYNGVPLVSPFSRMRISYLIVLRIPARPFYPHAWQYDQKLKNGPRCIFWDWQDDFIHTIAHEARHVEQYRNKHPRSEKRCEEWASWVLRKYQRERIIDDSANLPVQAYTRASRDDGPGMRQGEG